MTKSRKSTTHPSFFSALIAALLMTACAGISGSSKPEDIVRQRANERAKAFVKGDIEGAYRLTAPSYRKLKDARAYGASFGGGAKWEKAEVASVACEPQRCKVAIAVDVRPLVRGMFGATIAVQFEETWLLEEGNWWLHQGL